MSSPLPIGYDKLSPFMKVKKVHPNAIIPTRAHDTDAGLDVYSLHNTDFKPGENKVFNTGIAMAIPDGWCAIVKEKSGRAVNNGWTVGACVIDSDYRGELLIHLFNNSDDHYIVKRGEAIAQLVVVPVWTGQPVEVEDLDETERGEGKFGSTGLRPGEKKDVYVRYEKKDGEVEVRKVKMTQGWTEEERQKREEELKRKMNDISMEISAMHKENVRQGRSPYYPPRPGEVDETD